jgi:hypothetical protein
LIPPPSPFRRGWNNRALLLLLLAPFLYACWLSMMALHEIGHVLHAWTSGATVCAVRVPLAGFSITEFSTNPHPHFVAWGGPIWGCVLPLLAWSTFVLLRLPVRQSVQFFAGFCLIANGAYIGVGWMVRAGDAADLIAYGTPAWALVAFGVIATGVGLYLWHLLGGTPSPGPSSSTATTPP